MDKTERTIIGKDVIESLTTSMYDDPRFVYREYVQNSADAIDKARQIGLVTDGNIYITINSKKRRIEIEDDAIGIEKDNVVEILKNIAQSTKQKGVDKGFRGIGRLGGLGYCDKLVFETSAQGETVKSIMTWDAKELKNIIADRSHKEEASAVIDKVTFVKQESENVYKHYFKVILEDVTNDMLLDVRDIRQYLSMVAPLPFKKSFFSEKIYDELKKEGINLDEYNTFVNTDSLFKGYNWYIYEGDQDSKKKIGEVIDILFFKDTNKAGELLFWGWCGITEKNQSLNQVNFARGFRLRKANIQIGNDDTLVKLHRDKRFQFYFFGEVHALHKELHPNARRDYFSENIICNDFEDKLKTFFYTEIYKLCYGASKVNTAVKEISSYNDLKTDFEKKGKEGFINRAEKEELLQKLEDRKDKAEKAVIALDKLKANNDSVSKHINKIIERATSKIETTIIPLETPEGETKDKPIFRTDKLSKLNKNDRKFLGEIFTIINNVLTKDLAENLIAKIEEKYK
ncbi:MAG: ATP-binding protein [Chitinispirillales bacterium]|jgi:molecular chaperone HtpG|nr:ATP-binding protein [Chitinispirillales bacterium]